MSSDLTPAAQHLADRYARMLDLVGRCTRAVEEGNRVYLNDEAGELSVAADELSAAAAAITRDEVATNPATLLATSTASANGHPSDHPMRQPSASRTLTV